ncbi:MAG: glycosylase [Armatimonadetes bacterium]|nr:glycosylase [Candidatus Hippobium faecium]
MSKPKWLRDAVFYEIYPQSFKDSNGDGIGDIQGIIQKLDYVKSLGCNAIWLNPWYESPFLDAGYDITDFYKIAPRYGTNEDAKMLFEEAHRKNIRIVIDLVVGHTSRECEWFKRSQDEEKNEFTDRYIWCPYLAWRGDPEENVNEDYYISGYSPRGAYKVNFFYNQPALNFGFGKTKHPWEMGVDSEAALATKEEVKKILRFWLDMGCDGFRVDCAPTIVKRDKDRKETCRIWREIRKMMEEEYPGSVLISEWGVPSEAIKRGAFDVDLAIGDSYFYISRQGYYWTDPQKVYRNIVFDEKGQGDISYFMSEYLSDLEKIGNRGYMGMFTGNHDCRRLKYNMSDREIAVYFAFLMTLPCVPFVYYGDEIGMKYLDVPSKEGGDIRTGARTPMQWTLDKNRGFSEGNKEDLYLPVDESEDAPTAEIQEYNRNSLLNTVRDIINMRRMYFNADGELNLIYVKKNKYPFVYERIVGRKRYVIFLNPKGEDTELKIDYKSEMIKPLFEKNIKMKSEGKSIEFKSGPCGIGVYEIRR